MNKTLYVDAIQPSPLIYILMKCNKILLKHKKDLVAPK